MAAARQCAWLHKDVGNSLCRICANKATKSLRVSCAGFFSLQMPVRLKILFGQVASLGNNRAGRPGSRNAQIWHNLRPCPHEAVVSNGIRRSIMLKTLYDKLWDSHVVRAD